MVTSGHIFTSKDLELGFKNKRGHVAPVFLGLGYFSITFFISLHLPASFMLSFFFTPGPLKSVGTGEGLSTHLAGLVHMEMWGWRQLPGIFIKDF